MAPPRCGTALRQVLPVERVRLRHEQLVGRKRVAAAAFEPGDLPVVVHVDVGGAEDEGPRLRRCVRVGLGVALHAGADDEPFGMRDAGDEGERPGQRVTALDRRRVPETPPMPAAVGIRPPAKICATLSSGKKAPIQPMLVAPIIGAQPADGSL